MSRSPKQTKQNRHINRPIEYIVSNKRLKSMFYLKILWAACPRIPQVIEPSNLKDRPGQGAAR
jgi:hypothetical protein